MSNLDGLQRLIYLCHIKNDLNRKRRRFHYYLSAGHSRRKVNFENKPIPKHINIHEASKGYRKAKSDMRAMTKEMRRMRVDMGVRFIWSLHGAIDAIQLSDKSRLDKKHFKKFYEAEIFEMELFDEQN